MRSWFLLALFISVETAASGSLVVLGSTVELPAPALAAPTAERCRQRSAAPDSDARRVRWAAGSRRALDLASAGRRRGRGEPEPGCALGRAFLRRAQPRKALLQRRGLLLRSGRTLRYRSVSLFFASLDVARDDA